ncbi:hypothetical protein [Aminipila sp.]
MISFAMLVLAIVSLR